MGHRGASVFDGSYASDAPQSLLDRIFYIITVWGLGLGTTVSLCLVGALCYRTGMGMLYSTFLIGLVAGITAGLGTVYLSYLQRHIRIVIEASGPVVYAIGTFFSFANILFISALLALMALPVVVGFVIYGEAQKRKSMTFRQKADGYFWGIVPRLASH